MDSTRFVLIVVLVVIALVSVEGKPNKKKRKNHKCYGDPNEIVNYDPTEPCPDIAKLEDGKLVKQKKGKKNKNNRNMVIDETKEWPKSEDGFVYVPFEVDPNLDEEMHELILKAQTDISEGTCIRFYQRTNNESDYVYYTDGGGCWSYVGLNGGLQEISVGDGCEYKSVVIHETLHALGFLHEQSRPDRGKYIKVNFDNILEENWMQFGVASEDYYTTHSTNYECGSVMHYHEYAFSSNGEKTMTPVKKKKCKEMGNNMGLTKLDQQKVNLLYQC